MHKDSYEVLIVGDVQLTPEEEAILKLHPKFCIEENLKMSDLEHEQESALAKLRMEINKEKENSELTQEEAEINLENEARGRQVFNPVDKKYDSRKRRVTDLRECTRITLPKPLSAEEEALLESRRSSQQEIFKEYIAKNTDKNGVQKSNLTREESQGLKSLMKKISSRSLIVMKTDKSSKFVVTTEEDYIAMGQEHIKDDIPLKRQEIVEIEEKLNGHNRAWAQIWNSGDDHNHLSRIITSKTTHSENIADLYLMFKDHKEGKKTRPTATGHSSNSLGLSNAVAEVLEAVNNSESLRYNTISTEDMLARIVEYNKLVLQDRQEWQEKRIAKLRCIKCNIMEYVDCPNTENHGWESLKSGPWPPRGSPSLGTQTSRDDKNKEAKNLVASICCGDRIKEEVWRRDRRE